MHRWESQPESGSKCWRNASRTHAVTSLLQSHLDAHAFGSGGEQLRRSRCFIQPRSLETTVLRNGRQQAANADQLVRPADQSQPLDRSLGLVPGTPGLGAGGSSASTCSGRGCTTREL